MNVKNDRKHFDVYYAHFVEINGPYAINLYKMMFFFFFVNFKCRIYCYYYAMNLQKFTVDNYAPRKYRLFPDVFVFSANLPCLNESSPIYL